MDRRRFLARSSIALGAVVGFAGCLEGNSVPPPRRSDVFQRVAWGNGAVYTQFMSDLRVQSRANLNNEQGGSNSRIGVVDGISSNDLAPVGVASAKGRGRGASGRGSGSHSSAPKGPRGRAIWHGGDYDEWRAEHDDEVAWHPATVAAAGFAHLGTDEEYQESPPGPGEVEWQERWDSPNRTIRYATQQPGWCRVGARLLATNADHAFGWEAVDFKLASNGPGMAVTKEWKISPRL